MSFGLWSGKRKRLFEQPVEVQRTKLNAGRTREIKKRLDDAIKSLNLGCEDVQLRARFLCERRGAFQLGAQEFQMNHHCVQRILDLVRYARSDASKIRQPL